MSDLKDVALARISERANIAQFVSFGPGTDAPARFVRMHDYPVDQTFPTIRHAVEALMRVAPQGKVCVRSFSPERTENQPFKFALSNLDEVESYVKTFTTDGLYTIVNEWLDVTDGGVHGVVLGGVVEFAPDDIPRAVEKEGVASLPFDVAMKVLSSVYQTTPELNYPDARVEFGIYTFRRGIRNSRTVIWEIEERPSTCVTGEIKWPNKFSKFIGDKAYGLLIAQGLGFKVPRTVVFSRRVAPFTFGSSTGTEEIWLRTCPPTPVPGFFPTTHGWHDPFALMNEVDPGQDKVQSILAQEAISSRWAGALIVTEDDKNVIDGASGVGDAFMLGLRSAEVIPDSVRGAVEEVSTALRSLLGPVRFEWVWDGKDVWVVQLHVGRASGRDSIIVDGTPKGWLTFEIDNTQTGELDRLSAMIAQARGAGLGIELSDNVGRTSHFPELLRKANLPSRFYVKS